MELMGALTLAKASKDKVFPIEFVSPSILKLQYAMRRFCMFTMTSVITYLHCDIKGDNYILIQSDVD